MVLGHRMIGVAVGAACVASLIAGCGSDDDGGGDRQPVANVTLVAHRVAAQVQAGAREARPRFRELDAARNATIDEYRPSDGNGRPGTMDEFLSSVLRDVHQYWSAVFRQNGLPAPGVKYSWPPPGTQDRSACQEPDGTPGPINDDSAFYCPVDDRMVISQKFASDLWNGLLRGLGGQDAGYARTVGDFGVAIVVAHEYGHNIQWELGLYDKVARSLPEGATLPARPFELQADCLSGVWASSVLRQGRIDEGDVREALDTTLAIGDFDFDPGRHHGTPEERYAAWNRGYQGGEGASCSAFLDPAALGVQPQGGGVVVGDGGGTVIIGGG
jgi:predicted metalloprotease